jgi:hypothetical protein
MREALAARFDRDFVAVSPAERRPSRVLAVLRPARVLLTHPREAIAGVILLAAASAITVNALGLQRGRHPAPLFAGSRVEQRAQAPLPPARPIQSQAQPQPQPQTQAQPAVGSAAPVVAAARPVKPSTSPIAELIRTSEAPVRPAAVTADAKPSRDGIGELIRAGEAGLRPPANVGDPGRVAAAQRALIKLGYGPLKADGVMGVGTRQALERFEKDRRLPVTGELASRTLRDLTAQSGISVE